MERRKHQDLIDIVEIAKRNLAMTRCAGNRIVLMGQVCTHCGSARPGEDCLAFNPEDTLTGYQVEFLERNPA